MQVVFDQLLDIFFRAVIMVSLIPAFMFPALAVSAIGITCGELWVTHRRWEEKDLSLGC